MRAELTNDAPVDLVEYWPYGEIASDASGIDERHLFTGHEREHLGTAEDAMRGLDYMHSRYYGTSLGRFVSVDPVGGQIGGGKGWNRYSYVENNPVGLVDPTGMMFDVPNTMSGQAFGTLPPMVDDSTPQQRAITHGIMIPFVALNLAPVAIAALPTAATAAIVAHGAEIGTGAAVGFATPLANARSSGAPADVQVDATLMGTAVGGATGVLNIKPGQGSVAAVTSRLITDSATGQQPASAADLGWEAVDAEGANIVAGVMEGTGGPLTQIVVAGVAKLILDQGTSAFRSKTGAQEVQICEEDLQTLFDKADREGNTR